MKVIIDIPNVIHKEVKCYNKIECLEIYSEWIINYDKDLGSCYGVHIGNRTNCDNGYIEII